MSDELRAARLVAHLVDAGQHDRGLGDPIRCYGCGGQLMHEQERCACGWQDEARDEAELDEDAALALVPDGDELLPLSGIEAQRRLQLREHEPA